MRGASIHAPAAADCWRKNNAESNPIRHPHTLAGHHWESNHPARIVMSMRNDPPLNRKRPSTRKGNLPRGTYSNSRADSTPYIMPIAAWPFDGQSLGYAV